VRYRKLSPDGDSNFGASQADFHRDSPEGVAQAVLTRIQLYTGDWFLDTSEGLDWRGKVLGTGTKNLYNLEIRARILGTTGVTGLDAYASERNGETRALSVQATISTAFGSIAVPPLTFVRPIITGPIASTVVLSGPDMVDLFGADRQPLLSLT